MSDGLGVVAIFGAILMAFSVVAHAAQEDKPIAYQVDTSGLLGRTVDVIEFKSKLDPNVTCVYIPQDKLPRCVRPAS